MSKARDLADGKFDTDTLVVDAANNRVGIGTSSPANKLELASVTNGADVRLGFSATDDSGTTRTGQVFFDPDTNTVGFRNGGVNRLYVNSSGNVGIGTSSPGMPLDVTKAGGGNFVARFQNTTSATPYGVTIRDASSATNNYPLFQVSDSAGSAEYFRVNSGTGIVTMPYQPYFYAYSTAVNQTVSSGILPYDLVYQDTGNNYSTSNKNFTAPVAGIYSFTAYAYCNAGTSNHGIALCVNGNSRMRGQSRDGSGDGYAAVSMVIKLSVGDYVDVRAVGTGVTNFYGGSSLTYSQWSGVLLG